MNCHGAERRKGDFRIDNLSPKVGFEKTPQWLEIMERMNSGEMPPKKEKVRPSAEESAKVVELVGVPDEGRRGGADGDARARLLQPTHAR